MSHEFYLRRRKKLLRDHRKMMDIGEPLLAIEIGASRSAEAMEASLVEFERLLNEIPYIGGGENPLTDTLIQMTSMLALYRALKDQMPVDHIGELAHEMAQTWIDRYPRVFRYLIGRFYLSRFMQRRKRRQAAASQRRRYPGDFVFEFVRGDGETFDWGVNYLDCAIVKFFAEQGAGELNPYMCRIDFLMFPALGITLKRTQTRAQGCTHCDFRFQWGGAAAGGKSSGLLEIDP